MSKTHTDSKLKTKQEAQNLKQVKKRKKKTMAIFILKHQKKAKRSVLQINKNAFQKTKTQKFLSKHTLSY